jgi:hypothetical protein
VLAEQQGAIRRDGTFRARRIARLDRQRSAAAVAQARVIERERAERLGELVALPVALVASCTRTRPFRRCGTCGLVAYAAAPSLRAALCATTLARLDAARTGAEPAPPSWPAGLDEHSEAGRTQINVWIKRAGRERSLEEVLGEARRGSGALA